MGGAIQHLQRTQLALLQEACGRRTQVSVERCGGRRAAQTAELLRIEGPRLLLIGALLADEQPYPERVEIGFLHEAIWFSFRTEVLKEPPPGADVWGVRTPIRLVRRDARNQARIEIPREIPVTVRLTGMYDRTRRSVGRLRNVSAGGLGLVCGESFPSTSQNGEPHWLEFALPGSPQLFAFAARLAYLHNLPNGQVLQGWSFYATDDNAAYLEQLQEIARVLDVPADPRATGETIR